MIIGLPLIILRKPIVSALSSISSTIMPESHTNEELGYLEMYALAIKDGSITENERKMLDLQARSYGIREERRTYLEMWFEANHVGKENLTDKYGSSGINLMSVFRLLARHQSTREKQNFVEMDQNNDDQSQERSFFNLKRFLNSRIHRMNYLTRSI